MKTINKKLLKKLLKTTMTNEEGIKCDLFYTSWAFNDLMSKNIEELDYCDTEDILKNIFVNIEEAVLYYQKRLNEKYEEIKKIELYKEFTKSNNTLNAEYSNWVEIKKKGIKQ